MAKTRKGQGNTRDWFLGKWGSRYVDAALAEEGRAAIGPAEAAGDVVEMSGDLDRLLAAERERAGKTAAHPQRLLEGVEG